MKSTSALWIIPRVNSWFEYCTIVCKMFPLEREGEGVVRLLNTFFAASCESAVISKQKVNKNVLLGVIGKRFEPESSYSLS